MFRAFHTLAATAAMDRATLLLNHVLASEAAAMQRLRVHHGRCIAVQTAGWPSLLPALPSVVWRITPAGLLERCDETEASQIALRIDIDASDPAKFALQALAGERPRIEVAGDAALASDVNWLFDNLRWDIEDDLEALVGPALAHQLGALGRTIAGAVRAMAQTLASAGHGSSKQNER
jgi:ubiquinone biosynthesis protein UbiJ